MKVTIKFEHSSFLHEFESMRKARSFLREKSSGSWRKDPADSWGFENHDTLTCWNTQTGIMAEINVKREVSCG